MKYWALVTGASKGIGEAICIELASRGWNVLLTARSEPLLVELQKKLIADYNIEVEVYPCDLTDRRQRGELIHWVQTHGELSALVNNAGFGSTGKFDRLSIDREIHQQIVPSIFRLIENPSTRSFDSSIDRFLD